MARHLWIFIVVSRALMMRTRNLYVILILTILVAMSTNSTYVQEPLVMSRSPLNLDRYVPALLTSLTNKMSSGASACYRKHFGIGIVEWRVLAMLAVEDRISANRVVQVIGLDKSAVSRALQTLERDGHVATEIDTKDARRYTVSLTASGRNLHDRVLVTALERERLLLAALNDDEIEVLIGFLHRMSGQLDAVNAVEPQL
ncbi:MarR family winged helix-turn-helix transcriptional regulator [Pseudomonas bharatica]|nr:MarR family transcriptional regulator [Pseudomonas bharatica]